MPCRLPQIIVCRFILNLRQLEPTGTSWISDSKSHSLHFVGNMGQSLHTGGTDEDEENGGVDEIEVVPARTRFSSENTTPTEAAEVNGRRVYELWTQQVSLSLSPSNLCLHSVFALSLSYGLWRFIPLNRALHMLTSEGITNLFTAKLR